MPTDSRPLFFTTVNYLRSPLFAARACLVKRPPPGRLKDGMNIFGRVLQTALKKRPLLLSSSWGNMHPELMATAVIGLWPRQLRPAIIMLGCMWEPNEGVRGALERLIVKFADRAIHRYVVQSTEELTLFPILWGVPTSKVRFCPFFFSFTQDDLAYLTNPYSSDYVFAGGNSLRNYDPLVDAAHQLPDIKFVFATRLLDNCADIPRNVTAGPVSHADFVSLMSSAAAVVVPIQQGLRRAAGQQTYLNAMWLSKPTIVTDTLGVRDHIRDWETGLIVDGSPESYVDALQWVFDYRNEPAVACMGTAAHKVVTEQFSFDRHIEHLLAIMEEAIHDTAVNGSREK